MSEDLWTPEQILYLFTFLPCLKYQLFYINLLLINVC